MSGRTPVGGGFSTFSGQLIVVLCFLHIFGNPSRALAILHNIDPVIDRFLEKGENRLVLGRKLPCLVKS